MFGEEAELYDRVRRPSYPKELIDDVEFVDCPAGQSMPAVGRASRPSCSLNAASRVSVLNPIPRWPRSRGESSRPTPFGESRCPALLTRLEKAINEHGGGVYRHHYVCRLWAAQQGETRS